VLYSSGDVSSRNRRFGNSGVRFSKWVFSLALSGSSPATLLDLQEGVELLLVLRGADLSLDVVAGVEVEAADLRR